METEESEQDYFGRSMDVSYGNEGYNRDDSSRHKEPERNKISIFHEPSISNESDRGRRIEKQRELERQWRRTGCFSEANEALKWDYLKKTVFCGEFYENERERFDNERLADLPYVKYMTYWGVWKKCMDRNNLLDKDNE